MSPADGKSRQHSLAAMTAWAAIDPDERVERMRALSALAAAKRAAERAAKEARGEYVKPHRRPRSDDAMPPLSELTPIMGEIQVERDAAGQSALSYDVLMREASLRLRRSIAQSLHDALKDDERKL